MDALNPEVRPQAPRDSRAAWRRALEWLPFVGPPLVLLADLEVGYALVPYSCRTGATWPLHLTSLAAVLLNVAAFVLAWRIWHGAGAHWPGDEPEPRAQARFLGLTGLLASAFSVLVALGMALPRWVVGACL